MKPKYLIGFLVVMSLSVTVSAVDIPKYGPRDPRVRYVEYRADDIVLLNVRRGTVTRIVFDAEEKIQKAGSGFPSDCKVEVYEWCIVAEEGASQVWLKPKDGATTNNLEIKTDKRDYSFEFKVLSDAPNGRWSDDPVDTSKQRALSEEPVSRLIFKYAEPLRELPDVLLGEVKPVVTENERIKSLLGQPPTPRNWQYSSKIGEGATGIAPSMVFDDGRFTYFRFPKNRQVPNINVVEDTGEERRVNFTMVEYDLAAVHLLGRRFFLRKGDAVVGVWNEAFDPDGVAVETGVTVDGLKREMKK